LLLANPSLGRCVLGFAMVRSPKKRVNSDVTYDTYFSTYWEFPCCNASSFGVITVLPCLIISTNMNDRMSGSFATIFPDYVQGYVILCYAYMCKSLKRAYPHEAVRFLSVMPMCYKKPDPFLFEFSMLDWAKVFIRPAYLLIPDRDHTTVRRQNGSDFVYDSVCLPQRRLRDDYVRLLLMGTECINTPDGNNFGMSAFVAGNFGKQ